MLALDVLAVCVIHVCIDTAHSAIEWIGAGGGRILTQRTCQIGGYNIPPLLLGDVAYPVSKTLLKPYLENALTGTPE